MRIRSCSTLAALGLTLAGASAQVQTYTVDFFPEMVREDHTIQLRIIGPQEGEILETRLFLRFTTAGSFDAADLQVVLVAPVPTSPSGGGIFVTGEDLGWSGQGTFTAMRTFTDLNGEIAGGLWGFEVQSINDPPAYSGSFDADSRWEVDIAVACLADFNGDEAVSVQDIFDFLAAYFAGDPAADVNGADGVTVQDIFDYLTAYFAGCD